MKTIHNHSKIKIKITSTHQFEKMTLKQYINSLDPGILVIQSLYKATTQDICFYHMVSQLFHLIYLAHYVSCLL